MKQNKEQIINGYMSNLGISKAEAEELFKFDYEDVKNEEVENLSAKAKQCGRHYVRNKLTNEKKEKQSKPLDTEKINMINDIYKLLQGFTDVTNLTIKNATKELTFNLSNDEFSLTLTRHRKKNK